MTETPSLPSTVCLLCRGRYVKSHAPNGRPLGPMAPVQMYLTSRLVARSFDRGSAARIAPPCDDETRSDPSPSTLPTSSSPPSSPYKPLGWGSVAAIRPISFCDPSLSHRRIAFSDPELSARSHGEVLPDRERRVPGGRREGQAQAPRPHRREELRPSHAPSRVNPLSSLYSA